MARRLRIAVLLIVAVALGAAMALTVAPAGAVTGNPWPYTMNNVNADGLVVQGSGPGANNSALLVRDHLNQPIFTVLEAGGAAVMGDQFRVMHGADPFNGEITLSPDAPVASTCVRWGQFHLGNGHLYRCEGTPLAWKILL